jgi:hypothetical protein
MKFRQKLFRVIVIAFALLGVTFTGVFIAMQFGLLNVRGTIAERNASFFTGGKTATMVDSEDRSVIACKVHALADYAPATAKNIQMTLEKTGNSGLANRMLQSASIRYFQTDLIRTFNECASVTVLNTNPIAETAYAWADSEEWQVLKSAFIRDQDVIRRAAADAGVPPRILLGGIIGEQFRFFTSARDSFKQYFEPLKILASLSKFSFGIAGLKPETVGKIDAHLIDPSSPFYLGKEMEDVIQYPAGSDIEAVRFARITDTKDTYYSYLYVGLYMKQIMAQWQRAGYDVSERPDVLSTLYNLGFPRSIPKPAPSAGGAAITINGTEYTFGELGEQFYYSGELVQEFPY